MTDGLPAVLSSWNLRAEASPTTSPRVTRLQTPAGWFYLKEGDSPACLERDLDLLEYLASVAVPVPRHIAAANGRRYAVDEGKVFWLSPQLPGHHFAQFHGPLGLEQVERLALRLGELHRALASAPHAHLFPVFGDPAEHLLETLLARPTPFDVDRLQHLRGKACCSGSRTIEPKSKRLPPIADESVSGRSI